MFQFSKRNQDQTLSPAHQTLALGCQVKEQKVQVPPQDTRVLSSRAMVTEDPTSPFSFVTIFRVLLEQHPLAQ